MKIAIIDKKDFTLKLDNNAIKYEEHTIPFKLIDMLVLNHRVMLSTKDIIQLTKENITILIVSHNNQNSSIINSANTKNGDIKLAQYSALQNRLEIAKYFISQKFITHKEQLEANGIKIDIQENLEQIKNATQIGEIMGIEGSFARAYFNDFFPLIPREFHKSKRTKNPPLDPANALMSFWYSLYYNIITIKLLSYGFEPSIGYLHTPFREHNALASDLMELFRAEINQAILSIFNHQVLTMEDFTFKNGCYLKYDGRVKIWKEFVALVNILKPKLDKEIANLKKMING